MKHYAGRAHHIRGAAAGFVQDLLEWGRRRVDGDRG